MPPALYKKEEVPEKFYFEGPSRELFLSDFNFRFAQISESAFSYEKISTLPISNGLKIEDTDTEPQRSRSDIIMYFVYLLECADDSFYVGCTNNLEKRLKQHNNSKWGAHYTKIRRPVILKYSEEFKTLIEARKRENEIKGWRREKKLALILSKPKE